MKERWSRASPDSSGWNDATLTRPRRSRTGTPPCEASTSTPSTRDLIVASGREDQRNGERNARRYNEQHEATVILTSHYMEDVAALCPRIIVIDQGRIVWDGA